MRAVIAGAGSYGQVYLEYLREDAPLEIVGFIDDDTDKVGTLCSGLPVIGTTDQIHELSKFGVDAVLAPLGDNEQRVRILTSARDHDIATPRFIHSAALVPRDVSVGEGSYVLPGTIVMPFAEIADFAMVSTGVRIAHHTTIGQGAFLSTGVVVGAGIAVSENSFIGIGATVMTGVETIGAGSVIGAGAVVIHDVPPSATVVGNPARVLVRSESETGGS